MENDYMAETVTDSLKALEYALRPVIYQIQKDKAAEFLDIAEQGKVMMYGIASASDEIWEYAKDSIVVYAKKERAKAAEEKRNG